MRQNYLQRLQQQPLIPIWNRSLTRGEAALSEHDQRRRNAAYAAHAAVRSVAVRLLPAPKISAAAMASRGRRSVGWVASKTDNTLRAHVAA